MDQPLAGRAMDQYVFRWVYVGRCCYWDLYSELGHDAMTALDQSCAAMVDLGFVMRFAVLA
jgi:hypothetical protein